MINIDIETTDIGSLTKTEKMEIMRTVTSSDRIAQNVINAYEDFIELVISKSDEELSKLIDLKKINGVGDAYFNAYKRELRSKYKYFAYVKKYKDYELAISECKNLFDRYATDERIDKAIKNEPYYVFIEVCERSFSKVDKMLVEIRPDLKDSAQRCEALILEVLRRNEIDGNSRLNGSDLYYFCKEEYNCSELLPKLKDVALESNLIYYDEKSKDLSVMSTYLAECRVKEFITNKINNSKKLDIDWTKYTTVDGFEMTDEQSKLLELFCNSGFVVLSGAAGTGKTASIKGLIAEMEDNGLTYTLLTPTGKASRVLKEATNRQTSTIHRKCLGDGEIDTDVLIIDECTMVALDVFCMALDCITNSEIRVVLVGDRFQLTSIGLSKIFSDCIESKVVPCIELTQVFRYTSMVVYL